MQWVRFILGCCVLSCSAFVLNAGPQSGTLIGIVSFRGTPLRKAPLDLGKEPDCLKLRAKDPLTDETVVVGRGNGLANVVVYIRAGETENSLTPAVPVSFAEKGCRYKPRVLAVEIGQEIKISNDDPVAHNIHPIAKVNRDWSRLEPPGTPSFSYSYEKEEIIPVKCNIHPWMQGYFVVLKTSHFAITGEDGVFRMPDLPPGKYTVAAWHESLGTQSQEVTVTKGESSSLYFVFPSQP